MPLLLLPLACIAAPSCVGMSPPAYQQNDAGCERALSEAKRQLENSEPGEPGKLVEVEQSAARRAAEACGIREATGADRPTSLYFPLGREPPIQSYHVWSGPNGHCEYRFSKPNHGDTATAFYLREIMPKQQVLRDSVIGDALHAELDVDCITQNFASEDLARQSEGGDQVAQYAVGIALMRSGCEPAKQALPILLRAGRQQVPAIAKCLRDYAPGETLIPESIYAAAAIYRICFKDVDESGRLWEEAATRGYAWAEPLRY